MLTYPPIKFGGHGLCNSGDKMGLVYQMILQNHVTEESNNFMGRNPSRKVIILTSLAAKVTVGMEI